MPVGVALSTPTTLNTQETLNFKLATVFAVPAEKGGRYILHVAGREDQDEPERHLSLTADRFVLVERALA